MDQVRNPFQPGAGVQPPELVGRQEFLRDADVLVQRVLQGRATRSILLTGLRGVGKTVLLNKVKSKAITAGFGTIFVESPEDTTLGETLSPGIRTVIFELSRAEGVGIAARRALGVLKSFVSAFRLRFGGAELSLEFDPVPGIADSGDLSTDLPQLLIEVGHAATERGRAVAIFIDEMQYLSETELRALVMAMHRLQQDSSPVILVGAGLPSLLGLVGRARSYAERLFSYTKIGPLPSPEAKQAIRDPIASAGAGIEEDALDRIVELTEGYPYFLQEWGYHSWNRAPTSPVTRADVDAATNRTILTLDQGFFRVRYDRLTGAERRYLRAMAELGPSPHRTGEIASTLHVVPTSLGPTRATLINKGMIFSPEYGQLAFTVPLFDGFMKRAMPSLLR